MSHAAPRGLFVGLATLDVVHLVNRLPGSDEKIRALDDAQAAGGPAANAAVAFAAAGGTAKFLTRAEPGPIWHIIADDLSRVGVDAIARPSLTRRPPAIASILVNSATGQRAVVSSHDRAHLQHRLDACLHSEPSIDLGGYDVVEVDGHEADLAIAVAKQARRQGILVVFDGGSWKTHTLELLQHVEVAVVSSAFRPPPLGVGEEIDPDAVLDFLWAQGLRYAAVTCGAGGVCFRTSRRRGTVPAISVPVVDTLGAGDFFHGALAFYLARRGLSEAAFVAGLEFGAQVAARSVASFGTRSWLANDELGRQSACFESDACGSDE